MDRALLRPHGNCGDDMVDLTDMPDLSILRRNWPEFEDPKSRLSIQVGPVQIGGGEPVVIAGPCAVESRDQALDVARAVLAAGAKMLRGGAYKPRTDPHTFQGLGLEGLRILAEARRETGLPVVTEVMDPRKVEEVAEYADLVQVGSRSMQNFPLLKEVGKAGKPVLLKRGFSATLLEWLCAAEYIANEGNKAIVLCERGIRTACHYDYARHVLDLNILEPLRQPTPLPVIIDPSHAAGRAEVVPVLSRAAIAAGGDGLLVEVVASEQSRATAKCDAKQGILPEVLKDLVESCRWLGGHEIGRSAD